MRHLYLCVTCSTIRGKRGKIDVVKRGERVIIVRNLIKVWATFSNFDKTSFDKK